MIKRNYILFLLLLVSANGCIDPYESGIEADIKLITIEGSIIKGDSIQTVAVSITSPLVDPRPRPVLGCEVVVLDDQQGMFLFDEAGAGSYTRHIPDEQLVYDRQYMLRIITPEGEVFESEYELLNQAAAIDTVYYAVEDIYDAVNKEELTGVQFYIDIKAPDDVPRYFRWSMEETYEYTSTGPISFMYLDAELQPVTPDNQWEFYRCWITEKIPGLYLSNTINLTINEKKKIPLHYVSTERDRLKIRYNLLVNQYTMNEGAFNYWQQNRTATQESGGLYTGQPDQPLTNLCSIQDSTKKVLGYFWVSSKTEKRVVVPRPNDLFVPDENCVLFQFDPFYHGRGPFPIYIRIDEKTKQDLTGNHYCFDCRKRGGSLTPPSFWE